MKLYEGKSLMYTSPATRKNINIPEDHAVDLQARDVVPTLVEIGGSSVPVLRCPHGVVIVLAHENDGQSPQLSQVEGFADLTLVCRPISIEGKIYATISLVLVSKRYSRAQRDLSTHDTIPTIEILGIHVHAAPLTPHAPGLLPCQLGQHPQNRHTQGVGEAVCPVGSDDSVLAPESRHDARVHGLLA